MKVILVLTLLVACGCAEVRARKVARDGNALYRDGEYAAAVEKYRQSEELIDSASHWFSLDVFILFVHISARGQTNANRRDTPADWNVGIGAGSVTGGRYTHRFENRAGNSRNARIGGYLAGWTHTK